MPLYLTNDRFRPGVAGCNRLVSAKSCHSMRLQKQGRFSDCINANKSLEKGNSL